jgi:hypothetical protein
MSGYIIFYQKQVPVHDTGGKPITNKPEIIFGTKNCLPTT